jgi:hypothetical protein
MAGRIRTIKPEWRESESLGSCSDAARVMSATLILLADDHGNGRGAISYLAAETWTYSRDPRESLAKASGALGELVKIGYVVVYQTSGSTYFHLTGWKNHQKVDKPGKPRVPPPTESKIRESLEKFRESLAPDHDHDHDHDHERDHEREGEGDCKGKGRSAKPREISYPPDAFALADALREQLVTEKPNHELSAEDTWARRRVSWAKQMASLLRSGRDLAKAKALLVWVFGDQGGTEFRFRIDSPNALREKWDRIEVAMVQKPKAARSGMASPRGGGMTPREIYDMALEMEAEEKRQLGGGE